MSTRWAGVFVVLALAGVAASAAQSDGVYFEDRRAPVGTGGELARRDPAPAGHSAARLVWLDPTRAATGVDGIARDETRALLKRMDVSATWRIGEAGEAARPGEVRVILLDRAAARSTGEPILGATPPRFDAAPFVWIHVPCVRATVGLRDDGPLAAFDLHAARSFGVALGRVIAHELVHVMAPSMPHGKGLMAETLTRYQLTAARLEVEPAVRMDVHAALRGEAGSPPAETAVLAATTDGKKRER